MNRWVRGIASGLIVALWLLPSLVFAATPSEDLTNLSKRVDAAVEKLQAGDIAGARTEYSAFDDGWFDIEDGIRGTSRTYYRSIEDAMGDAKYALTSNPPDATRAMEALKKLRAECDGFINEFGGQAAAPQG